ncbi:MAG TPA: pyruvate kinase, partial [Candidatus Micrarchaeota archaeon]|nr:pyruvate kinase [Candidatus Micrarchaeota archaeon]
ANIDGIIESSDVVMVARGDLGIEMPLEKVPFVQKSIIEKCRRAGKASIVATQMLESMVYSTVPTRAEVSDIANAIIDGADALMLSGETANGKYPELAARTIMRIAEEAEKSYTPSEPKAMDAPEGNYSEIICGCARDIANSTGVTKILTPTRSGFTPRMISRFRVKKPIYALTENEIVAKQLEFHFGVTPIAVSKEPRKPEDCIFEAKKRGIVNADDVLAVTLGQFSNKPATNTVYYVDLKHSEFARLFKAGKKGGITR